MKKSISCGTSSEFVEVLQQIADGKETPRRAMEDIASQMGLSQLGLQLPSEESYRQFDQALLDELYQGVASDDIRMKVRKCCEYLGVPVEDKLSDVEIQVIHPLVESVYLNRACYDWHAKNM